MLENIFILRVRIQLLGLRFLLIHATYNCARFMHWYGCSCHLLVAASSISVSGCHHLLTAAFAQRKAVCA